MDVREACDSNLLEKFNPIVRDRRGQFRLTPARVLASAVRRGRTLLRQCGLEIAARFGRRSILGDSKSIVSMTTHGDRINSVHLAIESIARGTIKPERIILWLDDAEVFAALPRPLQRLRRRGLSIQLSDNYGPHTKYLPFVLSEPQSECDLVTADDDVLYPRYWLKRLMQAAEEHKPGIIYCHRAHVIGIDQGTLKPYNTWEPCASEEPANTHFATGVSGVLYPSPFQKLMKEAGFEGYQQAPTADDVWINALALRQDWKVRQLTDAARDFDVVRRSQRSALRRVNVEAPGNDQCVAQCYTPSMIAKLIDEND